MREFEKALRQQVVGQDRAVRRLARVYQVFRAGLSTPGRPVVNLLFLGPTGSGKTRLVEATAEALFEKPRAFVKVDCAEFQHSHEIAKLIGSPPGYLGHRETQPLITQEVLDQHHTEKIKLSLVLFDEIEKASDALWQLLLGILDKGTLTLGDNRRVDFSRTMIFLTSNLGSHEVMNLMAKGLVFRQGPNEETEELDQKIYKVGLRAAKKKFSKELMNRFDKVIVFRMLKREDMEAILDIELGHVQERIMAATGGSPFVFQCTSPAREFLLREGTDVESGARHLNRAIQRHLVSPLSCLMETGQVQFGDVLVVDFDERGSKLKFVKHDRAAFVGPAGITDCDATLVPVSAHAAITPRALARRAKNE